MGEAESGWCLASMGSPPGGLATLRDVDPDGDSGYWQRCKSPQGIDQQGRLRQRADFQGWPSQRQWQTEEATS